MWNTAKRHLLPGSLRRKIQRLWLERQVRLYPTRVVRHQYGDGELTIELPDPLAAGWYDHDWSLPPEIAVLRRSRLRQGAVVFDLGAHQGIVAMMLAREVGPAGRVVAVEALPYNAAAAARNRDLNQMPWIEVVSAAVARQDGELIICRSLNAAAAPVSDYGGTFRVPAVTVDTLAKLYGHPDVIYLDVEGMELEALRGAERTLSAKSDFFIEMHAGHGLEAAGGSVDDVLSIFPDARFEKFIYTESNRVPLQIADAPRSALMQRFFLMALSSR